MVFQESLETWPIQVFLEISDCLDLKDHPVLQDLKAIMDYLELLEKYACFRVVFTKFIFRREIRILDSLA